MFIINCKNYNEISGEKINKLALIAEKISKKYKIQIALAPPTPSTCFNKEVEIACICTTS